MIDGGNTLLVEIAVNLAGWQGQKLAGILHPGAFSMLGVGVSFALAAKLYYPESHAVVISGDGAFLSGGLSIEAAFRENAPITVVIDNNGGLTTISRQPERLFADSVHVATDFRDIPFHTLFEGLRSREAGRRRRNCPRGAPGNRQRSNGLCQRRNTRGVINPIVAAVTSKRDKASIE